MALSPVLDVCFETCSLIKFVDVTGVYSVGNTHGWGSPNIAGSAVTAATILITDEDGETVFEYDVLDQIPDTLTGDLVYTSYEYSLPDGEFNVLYTITTASSIYTYTSTLLNTCNFECCIDSLIATIPAKICTNRCDTDYIDEVLTIEGLFYGYMCAAMCEKTTIRAEIEKRLERFCDFQCNCN
jgi:hypothetical protein